MGLFVTCSVYPVRAAVCCSSPSPTLSTSEVLYRILIPAAYMCGLAFIFVSSRRVFLTVLLVGVHVAMICQRSKRRVVSQGHSAQEVMVKTEKRLGCESNEE